MTFFFQAVKGHRTLWTANSRLRLQLGYRGETVGGACGKVSEQEVTPEVCAVTSDTQHAPTCGPRTADVSGMGTIFFLAHTVD